MANKMRRRIMTTYANVIFCWDFMKETISKISNHSPWYGKIWLVWQYYKARKVLNSDEYQTHQIEYWRDLRSERMLKEIHTEFVLKFISV